MAVPAMAPVPGTRTRPARPCPMSALRLSPGVSCHAVRLGHVRVPGQRDKSETNDPQPALNGFAPEPGTARAMAVPAMARCQASVTEVSWLGVRPALPKYRERSTAGVFGPVSGLAPDRSVCGAAP